MIKLKNISKSFEDVKALDNVTLDIEEASVFGLIGTNGAGKSTLLRIMSGILKPESGCAEIDGKNVFENPK